MAAAGRKMGLCKPHQPAPCWMLELTAGQLAVGGQEVGLGWGHGGREAVLQGMRAHGPGL